MDPKPGERAVMENISIKEAGSIAKKTAEKNARIPLEAGFGGL
jgi:hypothetical protein